VLGPLEVCRDGQPLALGGERQRALLALLLIHANELVATEQLIDLLFGDQPSTGAVKALQVAISRLRRALGGADLGAVVQTRPGGYLLNAGRDQLDGAVFERRLDEGRALVIAGDPAGGAARLRDALALWRGPPLADLALVDCLQVEIRRWLELRQVAVMERIDADLALGAGSELIAELETLIAAERLQERLRGQLMLALYRAGRQADALALYRETSELLRDELGLEPSRALQELERSILQQHAALEPAPRATPAPAGHLPVPATPFLGGARELAELTPPPAVRKTVTVLIAELVDATSPGCELDPEVRGRVLSRCLGELRTVLERHGASVETHAGDVLIAVFGTPAVHEDDALRAVRAAVELRRSLSTVGEDLGRDDELVLAVRVGVATGEVIAEQGGLTVTGEPVKMARRLCELAAPSELLIGAGTHELVSAAVTGQALSGHTSANGQAIAAFRLDDVLADASVRVRRFDSPTIGRERQLAALRTVFTNVVCDRSCHLVTVLGAAGVGKSRLVEALAGELRESATVLSGCCLAYGEGITFWPLAEAVRGLVGNAEPSAAAIAALAVDDPKAVLIGEGVAVALGARDAPGASTEEVFWAARKLLEAVARRRALVVVFDDLHWAEPTFLDFVEHVSELVRDAPILLLCMARPELLDTRPAWGGGKLNATTVLLEPLDMQESRQLIASLLRDPPLPAAVVTLVAQASEGNPLFAEEFLAMLVDRGVLRVRDGQWVAPPDLSRLPVPPTINALLTARLERLAPGERSLLQRAAVEGAHFHRSAVCELSPDSPPATIDVGLASLVRKDLIRSDRPDFTGDDAYRFRHALIRDAAYRSLPKQARAELHERFGSWLEQTAAERLREVEATVGYHLAQAFELLHELGVDDAHTHALGARALRRIESAGQRALARGDRPAAIVLLERGKSLLGADDTRIVGLLTDLGTALFEAGKLSAADGVLQQASRLALAASDECANAKLLLQQQFLALERAADGATHDAARTVERVIPVLARHGDEYGLCRAFRLRALVHWFAAQTKAAADAWEQAAIHATRAGAQHERAEILVWIASSLVYGPTPVTDAIRRCQQITTQVQGNLVAQAATLPKLAALHAMEGRFDLARTLLASSDSLFNELGLGLNSAVSHHAALVELLAGNAAEAERSLRLGYLALEQMGDRSLLSTTAAYLARAILAQGRDQEAARYAARSDELAAAADVSTQAIWRGVQACVLARTGQLEDAERLARTAVALLEASDFVNHQGEALLDLATVLEYDRRPNAAGAALRASLSHFEHKGNTVAAGQVRNRLARIAAL
jgi:predicted ATPase/DNA-binding SARP family transcriptional activator